MGSPLATNYLLYEDCYPIATIISILELKCTYRQALAWNWDLTATCSQTDSDVNRAILETVNSHHQIGIVCLAGTTLCVILEFQPREFVYDEVFKVYTDPTISNSTAISVLSPCEHPLRPSDRKDRVRATAYIIKKIE